MSIASSFANSGSSFKSWARFSSRRALLYAASHFCMNPIPFLSRDVTIDVVNDLIAIGIILSFSNTCCFQSGFLAHMLTSLRLACQVLILLHFRYSKHMANYIASKNEEKEILKKLEMRQDAEATRIKRYLAMPDLSRTPGNPLSDIVEKAKSTPSLKDFDDIDIPEIIDTRILFDLFDFPADHPARSKSDTYYADDTHVLRTHDTVMWYYYLNLPEVKEKIEHKESIGVVCYGKVFRKDEIDRKHMNIFHQFGGLYLQPDSMGIVPIEELQKVLSQIVKSLFGENVKYQIG